MITKERIDELIQQRAKVWGVGKQRNVFCVGLKFRPETLKDKKWLENKYEVYGKLFETKGEAEWHAEFGCIERTDRLELPTWEEVNLLTKYTKHCFYGKDNALYGLCLSPKDSLTRFDGSIEELKSWCGIDVDDNCEIEHFEPLTKENYTLACRKCKELFLG